MKTKVTSEKILRFYIRNIQFSSSALLWKQRKEKERWNSQGTSRLCSERLRSNPTILQETLQFANNSWTVISILKFKSKSLHIQRVIQVLKWCQRPHICLRCPKMHYQMLSKPWNHFLLYFVGKVLMAQFFASTNMFNSFWVSEHRKIHLMI